MGVDDVRVESQKEDEIVHDPKHEKFMRVALDMVCQVDKGQSGKIPN